MYLVSPGKILAVSYSDKSMFGGLAPLWGLRWTMVAIRLEKRGAKYLWELIEGLF